MNQEAFQSVSSNHIDSPIPKLSIEMVEFKMTHYLAKASIGQIMFCFQRILNTQPKNDFEKNLYDNLFPQIKKLLEEYEKMLEGTSNSKILVRYHNLIAKLPPGTIIYQGEHGRIKMRNPKIGALIMAIKQRLQFIMSRDIPEIYKNNEELLKEFNDLKADCIVFYGSICTFEKKFTFAVRKTKVIEIPK